MPCTQGKQTANVFAYYKCAVGALCAFSNYGCVYCLGTKVPTTILNILNITLAQKAPKHTTNDTGLLRTTPDSLRSPCPLLFNFTIEKGSKLLTFMNWDKLR